MLKTPRLLAAAALGCALLAVGHAQTPSADSSRVRQLDLRVVQTEPEVATQTYANRTVEEYRYNGNPYMLKVTPKRGAAYFLVDPAGTGEFEWRRNSQGLDIKPPQWALGSW